MRRKRWAMVFGVLFLSVLLMALSPRTREVIKAYWIFEKGLGITGGDLSFTGGGTISLPIERTIRLPVMDAWINGVSPIAVDGDTAPGLVTVDLLPAALYANSTENASMQWSFRLPADFGSGLGFRVLCSTSSVTTSPPRVGWNMIVNTEDGDFASTLYDQSETTELSATANVSNDVVALVADATAEAALAAGKWVTVAIWNVGYGMDGNLEIKGVDGYYTATQ